MIFIDIIEKNPYLISLIEKYEFIKKLEEDFEIEKQIFIDLIGCLLSNLIEVSDNFINMFANSKIFFTILNVLKHDELIVPQKNIQLLKLLHNFLKIYSDIKLLSTYLNENIIKIHNEATEKLIKEKEDKEKAMLALTKYKTIYDDLKIKLKDLEEENSELTNKNKNLEEKINFFNKHPVSNLHLSKVSLKHKENLISTLKNDIQTIVDKYKSEKARLEKRIFFMDKDYRKIKEVLE